MKQDSYVWGKHTLGNYLWIFKTGLGEMTIYLIRLSRVILQLHQFNMSLVMSCSEPEPLALLNITSV